MTSAVCSRAKVVADGVLVPTSGVVQSANVLPLIVSASNTLQTLRVATGRTRDDRGRSP